MSAIRGWLTVRASLVVLLFAFATSAAAGASSQNTKPVASPTPQASPTPSPTPLPERQFFRNILRDQRAIWTSPFHLGRGDAKWLAPLGLSTLALAATDQETGELSDDSRRISVSRDISQAGGIYATGGLATAFYLAGRATGNARARETGLLGGEALIDTALVYSVLKNVSQRPRPTHDDASAEFFDGGHSFPSGHAASAWALATVVSNEYHDRRAVQFGAYGLAAAVSVSRYTARKHFLSDILVGGAIGYGIGRYVYRTHHDPTLDESEGQARNVRSNRFPLIAPVYDPGRRAYGATLAWGF